MILYDIEKIQDDFEKLYLSLCEGIKISQNQSEEKLKIEFEKRLYHFLKLYDIDLSKISHYEESSIGIIKIEGRADAVWGNIIVEFKKVGVLKNNQKLASAIKQISNQYLNAMPIDRRESFIGIVFDGIKIVFVRWNSKTAQWESNTKNFDIIALYDWILLLSGATKKQVSPIYLNQDFSLDSDTAVTLISTLYNKLEMNFHDERISMLFNEWDKTFRYIYGGVLTEKRIKKDFEEISTKLLEEGSSISVEKFLFVLYTYYALIVKLFASEIACTSLRIYPISPIRYLLDSTDIINDLRYIEEGKFFQDYAGVDNYIEGGFFSWYLDTWDDEIKLAMDKLLEKINEYDPQSFISDERTSRDLLKNLYQGIIPQKIRHDLGEFYTPDWLVKLAIEEANYTGDINDSILDPGCGSGGFIVEFINKIKSKNHTSEHKLNDGDLLDKICNNVIGFDVNPVAVLTARTNYLISICQLLSSRNRKTISLPIFMADSILTPTTEGKGKVRGSSYKISTVEGEFSLPKSIVDDKLLETVLQLIEHNVGCIYSVESFQKSLLREGIKLKAEELIELSAFYEKLLKLHKDNKNKIWAKIILNSFAPLLFSNFDYVIGNPPWIKWEFLSDDYKDKLSTLYLDIYKLFSHTGMRASLGFAHDDISIMFTYVAMDKYLKSDGVLSFVLKQTLYKSVAGNQFRSFQIEKFTETIPVKCLKVHDLILLNPFGKGQETSIAVLKKNSVNTYPVPYYKWIKNKRGSFKDAEGLDVIKRNTTIEELDAYPDPSSKEKTAIWITIPKGEMVPKVSNNLNYYKPRHGVVNDLNGVFIVDINGKKPSSLVSVTNQGDKGRVKTKVVTKDIESDLIYPLIKPSNVEKWGLNGYNYMIVPQRKDGEDNITDIQINYPSTYAYLFDFKNELLSRKSKWFKGPNKPFYSLFGIGDYTFQKYKIIWCCMSYKPHFVVVSSIDDEFIGSKEVIPDNTIGYISTNDEDEAHYICAILNSSEVEKILSMRSSKSKWGIPISMIEEKVPIPEFEAANLVHQNLSKLSKYAHLCKLNNDKDNLEKCESEINEIVKSNEILD